MTFSFPRFLVVVVCSIALPLTAEPGRWTVVDAATLADAQRSSNAGDVIALRAAGGPYRGPIALKSGQSLVGEEGTPVITATDGPAVVLTGISGEVVLSGLAIRVEGKAQGLVVAGTTGSVTLRDVSVSSAGDTGIVVHDAARLIVSGASSVTAVDAAALEISRANLDVTFQSVSARGTLLRRGIALESTRGRFVVEGGTIDGAALHAVSAVNAEGVTLRSMHLLHSAKVNATSAVDCGGDLAAGKNNCSAAVFLRDVRGAVLDRVVIDGSGQAGIAASAVEGFSLLGSEVRNAGDEVFEHGLLMQQMTGELRIASTKFEHSASRHVMLYNSADNVRMIVEKCTFTDTTAPNGQQALMISAAKNATVDVQVSNSEFARLFANAVDVTASDQAKVSLRVSGDTFSGQATAINVSATGAANVSYEIADNPSIAGSTAAALNLYLGTPSTGTLSGTIARNMIGKSGVLRSGAACNSCSGISITASGGGSLIAAIAGNTLQQTGGAGVTATAGSGSAKMALTIQSNRFREPVNATSPAIRVSSSGLASDTTTACANIGGEKTSANVIEGTWEPSGAIQLIHRFAGARFEVAGMNSRDPDVVAATISKRNSTAKVRTFLGADAKQKGFQPVARCEMPAIVRP